MSAPASVPAAVAESQNVSLTAWSGVTRSNGKYIEVTSPAISTSTS